MTSVRPRTVVLAGMAAGFVLNISGMLSAAVIGLAQSFGRFDVDPGMAGAFLHLTLRFGVGLAAAYLYAGMAARSGFGGRTVMRVGVAVWLIGYAPSIALLHEIGFLAGTQALLSGAWGLAEAWLGVMVAAAVCRRPSRPDTARTTRRTRA